MRFLAIAGTFPNEATIIGRIVIGYGELEIALMNAVHMARGGDLDMVLKVMYRTRGESQRVELADAMGRETFAGYRLTNEFETAIANMNFCRRMRNQYAHCVWQNDGTGQLGFVNLEEIAKDKVFIPNLLGLTTRHLDVPLLEKQEEYLDNTEHEIAWLNFESQAKQGHPRAQIFQTPVQLPRPPLYK
jgi:hypothetical protein